MKKITITLFSFFAFLSNAQTFVGGSKLGSTTLDNSQCMTKDASGNIFVGGIFSSAITFNTTTITPNGGNSDGFIAKYDSAGTEVWFKKFGGAADDAVKDVTTDSNGNIYVTGYFQGAGVNAIDVDPDPAVVYSLSQVSTLLSRDCFIVKLNANGVFVWAKQFSNTTAGALNEDSYVIKCDSAGNVYIGGRFAEADFDTSATTTLESSYGGTGKSDGFIVKLSPTGDLIWNKKFGGTDNDVITDLEIDANDNVIATGIFTLTADFDPSSTTDTATISAGNNDIFVVKLDSNGNYLFHKNIGGTASDYTNSIKLDTTGNIYLCGYYSAAIDVDPSPTNAVTLTNAGSFDALVLKLSPTGNYLASYSFGSTSTDQIYGIDFLSGNIILSGVFTGTVDFDNSAATVSSTAVGETDIFVLTLSPTFTYTNHQTFGSTGSESLPWVAENGGNINLIGTFENTIDIDPSIGTTNLTSTGLRDIFFTRYNTPLATVDNIETLKPKVISIISKKTILIENFEAINYAIFNTNGAIIKKGNVTQNEISVNDIAAGNYILNIANENKSYSFKIIKK